MPRPSGDGFVLMLPGAGRPVEQADGRPWVVTLEQVLAIGREGLPDEANIRMLGYGVR